MKRATGLITLLISSAFAIGLFANSPTAVASGNCGAKLLDKSYDCSLTDNEFGPSTQCWNFFSGGDSQYFDMDNGDDYGCGCDASGSSNFDHSDSAFECTDSAGPFSYNGKIKGKKLSVQGIGADGEQAIGTCTLRSSPCL
jgi:hypothetical protein